MMLSWLENANSHLFMGGFGDFDQQSRSEPYVVLFVIGVH